MSQHCTQVKPCIIIHPSASHFPVHSRSRNPADIKRKAKNILSPLNHRAVLQVFLKHSEQVLATSGNKEVSCALTLYCHLVGSLSKKETNPHECNGFNLISRHGVLWLVPPHSQHMMFLTHVPHQLRDNTYCVPICVGTQ